MDRHGGMGPAHFSPLLLPEQLARPRQWIVRSIGVSCVPASAQPPTGRALPKCFAGAPTIKAAGALIEGHFLGADVLALQSAGLAVGGSLAV